MQRMSGRDNSARGCTIYRERACKWGLLARALQRSFQNIVSCRNNRSNCRTKCTDRDQGRDSTNSVQTNLLIRKLKNLNIFKTLQWLMLISSEKLSHADHKFTNYKHICQVAVMCSVG